MAWYSEAWEAWCSEGSECSEGLRQWCSGAGAEGSGAVVQGLRAVAWCRG